MEGTYRYLAHRAQNLYCGLIELQGSGLVGAKFLRRLEALRREIFELGRELSYYFGEHSDPLEKIRADGAEKSIRILQRYLIYNYWRLLHAHKPTRGMKGLLLYRIMRSAQEVYFYSLQSRNDVPVGLWRLLHRAYHHACYLKVECLDIDDCLLESGRNTIAYNYQHTLLVASSRPLDLPRDHLPSLIELTRDFSTLSYIGPRQDDSLLCVSVRQDIPFVEPNDTALADRALNVDEPLAILKSLVANNKGSFVFNLKSHLLNCWNGAFRDGGVWQICRGFQGLLACLGVQGGDRLDASAFLRHEQNNDIWAQSYGRGVSEGHVYLSDKIELTVSTVDDDLPEILQLELARTIGRHFIGRWPSEQSAPVCGELLGVQVMPDSPWHIARMDRIISQHTGYYEVRGLWLAMRSRLCRIKVRNKLSESAERHALLISNGGDSRLLCPSLPLIGGNKVMITEGEKQYVVLLGEQAQGVFSFSLLE